MNSSFNWNQPSVFRLNYVCTLGETRMGFLSFSSWFSFNAEAESVAGTFIFTYNALTRRAGMVHKGTDNELAVYRGGVFMKSKIILNSGEEFLLKKKGLFSFRWVLHNPQGEPCIEVTDQGVFKMNAQAEIKDRTMPKETFVQLMFFMVFLMAVSKRNQN